MIVILMGVTGCGKTTVGNLLAQQLGWEFHDADSFHPQANVEKMRQGIPLTDEDRWPWLQALKNFANQSEQNGKSIVLACSALRQSYRDLLSGEGSTVTFVHLAGDKETIRRRLESRTGHYMNPKLLDSQFATLETPEGVLTVDVTASPETIVRQIRSALKL